MFRCYEIDAAPQMLADEVVRLRVSMRFVPHGELARSGRERETDLRITFSPAQPNVTCSPSSCLSTTLHYVTSQWQGVARAGAEAKHAWLVTNQPLDPPSPSPRMLDYTARDDVHVISQINVYIKEHVCIYWATGWAIYRPR